MLAKTVTYNSQNCASTLGSGLCNIWLIDHVKKQSWTLKVCIFLKFDAVPWHIGDNLNGY